MRPQSAKQRTIASPSDAYQGLRAQILHGSRAAFNLPPASAPGSPWGVVMDWGVNDAIATVVAISDGTASVYLSNGGGYLGGGESHESMRKAAQRAISAAAASQPETRATTTYPLPQRGEVIFYLLTDAGVFTARASQDDLSARRHVLWMLGEAMQQIITEYQRISGK